jgi:tetratricopeptide (TPR) repeat protein
MKWLKRLAFALAVLVTLTVLVLAFEGWRAKRAWEGYKEGLSARGEKLDWASFAPPPVPDDQNFLATPALAACFGFGPAQNGAADTEACEHLQGRFAWAARLPGDDWRTGMRVTLDQWQAALRATNDLVVARQIARRYGLPEETLTNALSAAAGHAAWTALQARPRGAPLEDLRFLLAADKAILDEIRAAARRPVAQLQAPTDLFSNAVTTWQSTLKCLTQLFRVSCRTELEAGTPEAAAEDFMTLLALADAAGSQPVLINALVKVALLELATQPLWAGLAEHRWSASALARIEARLERLNVVADFQRGLRGERAFALALLGTASAPEKGSWVPENPYQNALRYWPRALVYRNQLNVAQAYQAVLLDRLDPAGPAVRVTLSPEDEVLRKRFGSRLPYTVFAALLLPAVERSLEKAAASQATITLARVACALERHRLATGAYPESLDELVPRFLNRVPPDPVNGGPLRYRREAPDRFLLYSVALDGKDDGGRPAGKVRGHKPGEVPSGDWVWRSAPSETPVNF